jgi:hypothetical protein
VKQNTVNIKLCSFLLFGLKKQSAELGKNRSLGNIKLVKFTIFIIIIMDIWPPNKMCAKQKNVEEGTPRLSFTNTVPTSHKINLGSLNTSLTSETRKQSQFIPRSGTTYPKMNYTGVLELST